MLPVFLPVSVTAQLEKYHEAERQRIKDAQATEIEIENFISKNMENYILTPEVTIEIKGRVNGENGKKYSEKEIQTLLTDRKRTELRALYFELHPETNLLYKVSELPSALKEVCDNSDFESGLTGYTFYTSNSSSMSECTTPTPSSAITPTTYNDFTAKVTMISSANPGYLAFDPSLNITTRGNINIPTLSASGSTHCIKLNNSGKLVSGSVTYAGDIQGDKDVTTMRKNIRITKNSLDYEFSLLLQTSGHLADHGEPVFIVSARDSLGTVISSRRCIIAKPDCIFSLSHDTTLNADCDILYTGWICDKLDVTNLIGEIATIDFTIVDCNQGGHFGTVYIDNICNSTCTDPAFGFLTIKPVGNCPDISPGGHVNISGTFSPPVGATIDLTNPPSINVSHNFVQPPLPISSTNAVLTMSGNNFNFAVNNSVFTSASGTYQFTVTINYSQTCNGITTNSSITGIVEVIFTLCCQDTLTSASTITGVFNAQRNVWIKSTDNFSGSSSKGVYHAGNYVELNPGFKTTNNAKFAAYIKDCTSNTFIYRPAATGENELNPNEDIHLIKVSNTMQVYPNPGSKLITVSIENEKMRFIKIFSIDGKSIFDLSFNADSKQIDVSKLAKGVYIITAQTENGKILDSKFIKE